MSVCYVHILICHFPVRACCAKPLCLSFLLRSRGWGAWQLGLLILLPSGISVRSTNVWCFETWCGMSPGFCFVCYCWIWTFVSCTCVKDLLNVSRQQSMFVKNQIEWKACLFCGGQFGLSNGSNVLPPMFMFPPRTCPVLWYVLLYCCLAYPLA